MSHRDEPEGPKSFLDGSIHWNDPVRHSNRAPLIGRIPALAQPTTIGVAVGLTVIAMALYDWPPGFGGLIFAGGGLVLAALCLYMIVRASKKASEQDKSRLHSPGGDIAP